MLETSENAILPLIMLGVPSVDTWLHYLLSYNHVHGNTEQASHEGGGGQGGSYPRAAIVGYGGIYAET